MHMFAKITLNTYATKNNSSFPAQNFSVFSVSSSPSVNFLLNFYFFLLFLFCPPVLSVPIIITQNKIKIECDYQMDQYSKMHNDPLGKVILLAILFWLQITILLYIFKKNHEKHFDYILLLYTRRCH